MRNRIDLSIAADEAGPADLNVVLFSAASDLPAASASACALADPGEAVDLPGSPVTVALRCYARTMLGWRYSGAALTRMLSRRVAGTVALDVGDLGAEEIVALIDGATVEADGAYCARTERPERREMRLVLTGRAGLAPLVDRALQRARRVSAARLLASRPANDLTPDAFEAEARAGDPSILVEVVDADALDAMGAGAITAVGRGSGQRPRIVLLDYRGRPEDADIDLALVGKGLTFDGGGVNLKTFAALPLMKFDMAGAATVLETVRLAAARCATLNIVGALAIAENLQSGDAYRPGDVLRSLKGLTIEVGNTDAEGRLVLADAITLIEQRYRPHTLIDVATLTGSTVDALGEINAALFSPSDDVSARLLSAAHVSGEGVWRMPMEGYDHIIASDVADVSNWGALTFLGNGAASGVAGAKFLERFVETSRWAHLDIAGTAWSSGRAGATAGATGYGVRLLDALVAGLETERQGGGAR